MASKSRENHREQIEKREREGRKQDKRTNDSLKKIRNAYAELLGEGMDPLNISVAMLSRRANIDRKTFYNYYDGIYALDKSVAEEIAGLFRNAVLASELSEEESLPFVFFSALTDVLNEDIDFYGAVFRIGRDKPLGRTIINVVRKEIVDVIKKRWRREDGSCAAEVEIAADFVIAGCLCVYQNWYEKDPRPPLREYSEVAAKLCRNGISSVLGDRG